LSADLLYWVFMGISYVAAGGTALAVMLATRRFARAFFYSLAVNAVIHAIASVWWFNVSDTPLRFTLGRLLFYFIDFVNVQVLITFALISIKKQPDTPSEKQGG